MVKRIIQFFHKETNGLHQAAYLLGFFAFLSQLLGLVRDKLLAHVFGAGLTLDTYYAAFRIPDFIFVTVASVVSLSVLIPILVEKAAVNKELGKTFVSAVFTYFFTSIVVISALFWVLMPSITAVVFPGIKGAQLNDLVYFSRIFLLSPIFLGISNIFGSITQAYNRFILYSLSPIVYNAGIVFGVLALSPRFGIEGVVYGVIIGSALHFLIQIPFIRKTGLLPRFSFAEDKIVIRRVFALSIPRTLTLAMNHVSALFLISFASLLASGSISIYTLSSNLQSVPLSIIGVSYSLAAFPALVRLFNQNKIEEFTSYIIASARHVVFWSVPVAVLFIVLRAQIVRTVFGSGAFDWQATRLTAASLAIFVFSVVFQSLIVLFVRGYYAAGKTYKPFAINALSAVLTVGLSYVLIKIFETQQFFKDFIESLLRVSDIPGTSVLMLALSFAIGSIFNGFALIYFFVREYKAPIKFLSKTTFQALSASIIMGFVSYKLLVILSLVFDLTTVWGIFLQGLIAGLGGIAVGIFILYLLGSEELKEAKNALTKKFFGVSVVGPSAEVV